MQYGDIALVYDALMYDMPYEKWAEFINRELKGAQTVLEMGCGTGSITEILSAYYDITALDLSDDMLELARQKLMARGRQARFVSGDMCEFLLNKPLDSCICVCDGINYLTTPEKVKQAFLNVNKNIKAGGRFIFDISSKFKLEKMDGQLYSEDADDVIYIWRNNIKKDLLNMDITFFITDDGINYQKFEENHIQRIHTEKEISSILEECGFKILSITDNYTYDAVKEDTMRITFCAQKI